MNNNIILTSKRNNNGGALNAAYAAKSALSISSKVEPQHKNEGSQSAPRCAVGGKIM